MKTPRMSIIAAIGKNRELGKNNALLWDIPEDMRYFRDMTNGHAIIMGQKTYESIGRPLPNRTTLVLTQDRLFKAVGCLVCYSLKEAVILAQQYEKDEIFIIGGASVYSQYLHDVDRLYLTRISASFDADVFFPEYEAIFTTLIETKKQKEASMYKYDFVILEK